MHKIEIGEQKANTHGDFEQRRSLGVKVAGAREAEVHRGEWLRLHDAIEHGRARAWGRLAAMRPRSMLMQAQAMRASGRRRV